MSNIAEWSYDINGREGVCHTPVEVFILVPYAPNHLQGAAGQQLVGNLGRWGPDIDGPTAGGTNSRT